MKHINKDSLFPFSLLIKNIKTGVALSFFMLLMILGICFICLELLIHIEKDSQNIIFIISNICLLILGIYLFIGGILPICFKKMRSCYFDNPNAYEKCITGLCILAAIGFVFIFYAISCLIVILTK